MPDKNTRQGAVQGIANIYADKTKYNQIAYLIRAMMGELNVALPVKVTKVMPGNGSVGYVQALPLVNDMDAQGNAVDVAVIPSLPYFRLQGGKAAVITDPVVGDIGLAVFAQKDTSNVVAGTGKPVQAGSFRKFSMSDGWYIGGFLNQTPETFLQLNQDGTAVLTANSGVTINGNVTINGELNAKGITFSTHKHTGVQSGGSMTGSPTN